MMNTKLATRLQASMPTKASIRSYWAAHHLFSAPCVREPLARLRDSSLEQFVIQKAILRIAIPRRERIEYFLEKDIKASSGLN